MGDTDSILRKAKDLFNKEQYGEAEALLREYGDANPSVLNFRAYLLYRQDRHEEAERAYSSLIAVDSDPSHLVSLGLIRMKLNRIEEAKDAFERALARRPGDQRVLRNLGHCYKRLGDRKKAADYFNRAEVGKEGPARSEAGSFASWLERNAPSSQGPQVVAAPEGKDVLFLHLEEKVHLNSRRLVSYSGVVVFSPTSRDFRRAAARFGERNSQVVRAEGTGELGISGLGRTLYEFSLSGDEHVSVNYDSLVLFDDGVEGAPSTDLVLRKRFMKVDLRGEGRVVLALGNPVVLRVPEDCPVMIRPSGAAAWTASLRVQYEAGPPGGGIFSRREESRYLCFEGEGFLMIQGSPD